MRSKTAVSRKNAGKADGPYITVDRHPKLPGWRPTFELREVLALCSKASRSERSTEIDIPCSTSTDLSAARWKASEMVVGCRPGAPQTAHRQHTACYAIATPLL